MPYCALPLTLSGVSSRLTGLADQLEILVRLEDRILRRGQLGRGRRQRAITQPAVMGVVDHLAIIGAQAGGIDMPLLPPRPDTSIARALAPT